MRTEPFDTPAPLLWAIVLILFPLLVLPAAPAFGDAAASPPPDVALEIHAVESASAPFRTIIVNVIQDRLAERGLVGALLPDSVTADADAPPAAKALHAAALLSCRYSASGSTLQLAFSWSDIDQSTTGATFSLKGPLDINMDGLVLQGLDGMLAMEKDRVDSLAAARGRLAAAPAPVATAPAPVPAVSPAAPTPSPAPAAPAAEPAEPAGSLPAPSAAPAVPAGTQAAGEAPPEPMRFVLHAGGSAFVPFGPAAAYFSIAGAPSLDAALDFPVPPGRLAVGILVSSNIFSAVGPIETATGFLIPFGPDVRYTIGSGKPLTVFAHVSGGPAVLVLSAASQGVDVGMTGYLKSGLGAGFMFGPRFGLELTADYEVYFEMPYLIMGISSTLQAVMKL